MSPLGMIPLVLGVGFLLMAAIWFIVATFRESVWWGLGCLLFSPLSLLFMILHWEDASGPFFTWIFGTLLVWLATGVVPV